MSCQTAPCVLGACRAAPDGRDWLGLIILKILGISPTGPKRANPAPGGSVRPLGHRNRPDCRAPGRERQGRSGSAARSPENPEPTAERHTPQIGLTLYPQKRRSTPQIVLTLESPALGTIPPRLVLRYAPRNDGKPPEWSYAISPNAKLEGCSPCTSAFGVALTERRCLATVPNPLDRSPRPWDFTPQIGHTLYPPALVNTDRRWVTLRILRYTEIS